MGLLSPSLMVKEPILFDSVNKYWLSFYSGLSLYYLVTSWVFFKANVWFQKIKLSYFICKTIKFFTNLLLKAKNQSWYLPVMTFVEHLSHVASIILISSYRLTHSTLPSAVMPNLQSAREGSVNIENRRLCSALNSSTCLCVSVKSLTDLDWLNWGRWFKSLLEPQLAPPSCGTGAVAPPVTSPN